MKRWNLQFFGQIFAVERSCPIINVFQIFFHQVFPHAHAQPHVSIVLVKYIQVIIVNPRFVQERIGNYIQLVVESDWVVFLSTTLVDYQVKLGFYLPKGPVQLVDIRFIDVVHKRQKSFESADELPCFFCHDLVFGLGE